MSNYDGAAIRALVEKLPPHAFDELCAELPEVLDSLAVWQVDYINWEQTGSMWTKEDVAKEWGYESFNDMQESDVFWVIPFDDGLLIIE